MDFVMSFYISIHHYICFSKNIFSYKLVPWNMSLNRSINLLISNFKGKTNHVFLFLWCFKNIHHVGLVLFLEFREVTVKVVLKEERHIKLSILGAVASMAPCNLITILLASQIFFGSTNWTFSGPRSNLSGIGPLLSFISVCNMIYW